MDAKHLNCFKTELEKNAGSMLRKILIGTASKKDRLARVPANARAAVKKEIMSLPTKNKHGKAIKENVDLQGLYKFRRTKGFVSKNPIDDAVAKRESEMIKKMEKKVSSPLYNSTDQLSKTLPSLPGSAAVIGGLGLAGAAYGGMKYRDGNV